MDARGTYCHPLEMWAVLPTPAALQRDVDLPEVLCPPPVSANVLDVLQCLTRCEMFLFQQLIRCRIPVFLELWHPALNLSFVLPSKQWHRESSNVKPREFFLPYPGPLLCSNQDPSETFQVDSAALLALYWNSFITVNGTIPLSNLFSGVRKKLIIWP